MDGSDNHDGVEPVSVARIRRDRQFFDAAQRNRRKMFEQGALVAAAQRIGFIREIGETAAGFQVGSGDAEKMLGERCALRDQRDVFLFVQRVGMKKYPVELSEIVDDVLP